MEATTIRPATADELNFVIGNWLTSWRTSRYAGVLRNCDYYPTYRTLIEDLIARGAKILVADAGRTLKGFVCYEVKDGRVVLHYIYCKDVFLRTGVEESLLDAIPAEKPGWFTFYNERFGRDRRWNHAPEIARRKNL